VSRKTTIQRKQQFIISIGIILVLGGLYIYKNYSPQSEKPSIEETPTYTNALERAYANYSMEVSRTAEELRLPYEYLMALITLETSGFKPAGTRFEKHVFKQLKKVKSGKLNRYENIKKKTLKDAKHKALKNLATSWGPFQLMGYKCVGMEVNVHNLRSEKAVYYGAKWIKEEYGRLLKKKRYKDAFHYHNTGRKVPRNGKFYTHDPKYIPNGLKYIEYFKKHQP